MDIKLFLLLALIGIFLASCDCKEDKYGEILELEVPITTYPMKDTFNVGDTLWIEANFEKDVSLYNSSNTIRLDSFNFFTEMAISEISGTTELFGIFVDTVVEIGKLSFLPLATAAVYPIQYEEDADTYRFKAGLILTSKGLFLISIITPSFLYEEEYNHPALFSCGHNKRDKIEVYYYNQSTNETTYNNLFLQTNVQYLKDLLTYEKYANSASITIRVQ